jgi:hypothetical protein
MSVNPSPIRVLSVDDHPLLREAVAALLAAQLDMAFVAEASNGREAIEQFRIHRPDVTLMDLQMPVMKGLDGLSSGSISACLRAGEGFCLAAELRCIGCAGPRDCRRRACSGAIWPDPSCGGFGATPSE